VCVALGGFRKRAVDIAVTSIVLIVLMPILLATAGLVRLLVGKAVVEVDKRIGLKAFAAYQFYSGIGEALKTVGFEVLKPAQNTTGAGMLTTIGALLCSVPSFVFLTAAH
jgi:lipopolysaccharide/colanic/teichoic acid biosynthesis glycosyltransferase